MVDFKPMVEVLISYDLYKKIFYDDPNYIDKITEMKDKYGKIVKIIISD